MASKKDMRRDDLVIPYVEPEKEKDASQDTTSNLAQMMPMVAMFSRQKMVAWVSMIFAVQHWLSETPDQKGGSTPGYFSVLMSLVAIIVSYMSLFIPPPAQRAPSGTGEPSPVPPSHT